MKQRDIDRFWSKVDKTAANGCWEFKGHTDRDGYGIFTIYFNNKSKDYKAHRISYQLTKGPIQPNHFICHHCDNPSCVNPAHLFMGSPHDNMIDMIKKGRDNKAKGEQQGNSKLTDNDVRDIKSKQHPAKYYAKKYNVAGNHIYLIWNNKIWKHI